MNITKLEKIVMINIAENEMTELNGAIPSNAQETCTWTDSIEYGGPGGSIPDIDGRQLSGVMSSLIKKELVWTMENREDRDGGTSGLTEEGFKVYVTFNRTNDNNEDTDNEDTNNEDTNNEETNNEETKENNMNEMNVNAKAVKTVDNFFNGVQGTAIRTGKRAYVKQLLNRESNYRLSDYVRKLRKDKNVIVTVSNIRRVLKRMAEEGQIRYEIIGNKVYGYSL